MTSDVYDDSDFESTSETSSEEQDDIFSVYGGHAQNILFSLEDSIGKIDDFLSFERAYVHGDVVRSVENPCGHMGRVVQVNMFVDLESVFGKVIQHVSSSRLLRLRTFSVGDYVIHGPWLGRVDKIIDCVGVLLNDGTKCEVLVTDPEKLVPISPNLLDENLYPYHPGQRVKVGSSSFPKSSGWLCGMSNKSQDGVICSVEAGTVYVDWLASASGNFYTNLPPPSCTPDPKELTTFSCFPHTNWQVGEWCILPDPEEHIEATKAYPCNPHKEKWKLVGGSERRDFASKLEDMFVIVKKRIKVDIMWQDGSLSEGLDSHSVFPVGAINVHDFFPEQLVLERASVEYSGVALNQRWGVVKLVDANEHTLKVDWRTKDEDVSNMNEKLGEEVVSAYELIEHPDLAYGFGDIVFLLEKHHSAGQPYGLTMRTVTMSEAMIGPQSSTQTHVRCFLSSIGNVIGFKNGNVQVQWASGVVTEVAPCSLVRVDRDDGSITTHVLPEENVNGANNEPAELEKITHKEKDSFEINQCGEDYPKYVGDSSFIAFPLAAIGYVSNLVTNIFKSPGATVIGPPIPHFPLINEAEADSVHEQKVVQTSNMRVGDLPDDMSGLNQNTNESLGQKVVETTENKSTLDDKSSQKLKQFDIASDSSDHHFNNTVGKGSSQVRRGWLKKVQHEWSILEKDLPENIYVRIYGERMDLIRAAIVGAAGTPYHDGLFFFDIYLPPDYPHEPPMVHYHSGGLRLNPNLYESGRVCLSLLNTWNGVGSEVWNPDSSTVLQVLLSLQALVLNEKPYFNEAGYDKQIGRVDGEKNSVSYNENAFLGNCRSMLYLMKNPPRNFKELVEEHFKQQSQQILLACKAYMESTPVGLFRQELKDDDNDNCKGNSTGFKIMLAKLFPKLVDVFAAEESTVTSLWIQETECGCYEV